MNLNPKIRFPPAWLDQFSRYIHKYPAMNGALRKEYVKIGSWGSKLISVK